jgi:hypothetical protein
MSEFLSIYFPFYFMSVFLAIPPVFKREILGGYSPGYDKILSLVIAIFCIILFGFRDFEMGTDTKHYIESFNQIQFASNFKEALNARTAFSSKDPFFNVFTYYTGKWLGLRGYFIVLAVLFVIPIWVSVFQLTKTHRSLILVCFMGLIAFPNMGVNIVRSAASISFCLLSLTMFSKMKWIKGILFFFISIAFHFSTILIFIVGLLILIPFPFWLYITGLFILTILSYKGYGLIDLPIIGELLLLQDRLSGYISGTRVTGSLSPFIILFFYGSLMYSLYFKPIIEDLSYDRFIKIFIVLTGFYFMTFGLNDSYRFGFFPAIFVPILICYPILNYKFEKNIYFIMTGVMVLFLGLLSFYRTF